MYWPISVYWSRAKYPRLELGEGTCPSVSRKLSWTLERDHTGLEQKVTSGRTSAVLYWHGTGRYRANVARNRQSRPGFGHGVHVQVLKPFEAVLG